MSELVELPHELLLRRYGISISQLNNNAQQMKRDLDRVITMTINKSRNGQVVISPSTESKIETYDRYICDGIFEYLENADVITEGQSNSLENQMDAKRDSVMSNMNNSNQNSSNGSSSSSSSEQESSAKIGFWDWK